MKRGLKYTFILVTVGDILALLVILLLAPIFKKNRILKKKGGIDYGKILSILFYLT